MFEYVEHAYVMGNEISGHDEGAKSLPVVTNYNFSAVPCSAINKTRMYLSFAGT